MDSSLNRPRGRPIASITPGRGAGIAASMTNNGQGISSPGWGVKIMPVRIAYSNYSGGPWITTTGKATRNSNYHRSCKLIVGSPSHNSGINDLFSSRFSVFSKLNFWFRNF